MPYNAKVSLVGNLTKDPTTRKAGERSITAFSVAVNTGVRKDSGFESNFYDVSVFGQLGEYILPKLQKGTQVWVNGDLALSEYQAKDGTTRQTLRVTATDVRVLARGKQDNAPGMGTAASNSADNELPF